MSSRGLPSMTALLGLLAIAGYQNRDKIAEMLGGLGQGSQPSGTPKAPGAPGPAGQVEAGKGDLGGLLGKLGAGAAGASAGTILSGGLGELIDRFTKSGQAETADSWVQTGPNKSCTAEGMEKAIGPDVLDTLSKQTGLDRKELLARLCREVPDAVDKYTPQGKLPEPDDARA